MCCHPVATLLAKLSKNMNMMKWNCKKLCKQVLLCWRCWYNDGVLAAKCINGNSFYVFIVFYKKYGISFVVSTIFSTFAVVKNMDMWTKEKLVERFKKKPKDFTYDETVGLLSYFGYEVHNKGATSGSRVRFKNMQTGIYIDIHRPHPGSIMKEWMLKAIYQHLKSNNLI